MSCSYWQWPAGETETKPVVVFIKDSRESNNADSDDDTTANERLQDVVGNITTSFSSARHNSQLIQLLYRCLLMPIDTSILVALQQLQFPIFNGQGGTIF